ncbi:Vacuolar calcium ion transporter [Colletotrichum tanaceti]|uniref:Vacuolar calcium ion transporter n=1 Tax=Colletotrichum tanaceti TaxID=1306861 RepID=A0A4U6XS56_9PEZI|nr:Vacuolar calcium ion transporter [Colletotrichum tanaceti]TKW58743.1 Vacuolar calcium ion transporter [Colletotrichum tanaceti]
MSASRSPYRQTYRQSTGSRRREPTHPVVPPEKARTSGHPVREELPVHNARHHQDPPPGSKIKVKPSGESGRRGFHPFKFLKIVWKSSSWASRLCNVFWPVVPAVFVIRYTRPNDHVLIFVLTYMAMIPCANLVGFAGQELSRKVSHVFGVMIETTFGSIVEIILFMVLLAGDQFTVIKAAILGSILATMLLCLGLCFIAGGLRRDEAEFSETVSEAGSGLLLTAGVALAIPAIFSYSMAQSLTVEELDRKTLHISRIVSVLLMIAYGVFVWFQARTHHGIYDAVFERDEQRDHDKRKDAKRPRLTLTECVIALFISIPLVTFMAIYLVEQIHPIVLRHGISDHFMGLILVPLVEKAAEHLTAVDEAWDNQMNFALSHVLGATLQTALLNGPLVVIVAWGLHKRMDMVFEVFDISMLILAILTVGNFLRDQKSNYLEGFLCVIVYLSIAVAAFYYPNPPGLSAH